VTKGVTCAATTTQKPGRLGLRLRPEYLPPVLEGLAGKAMRLAVLPLIQVAALPCLMMRAPKSLTLAPPGSMFAFHFGSPSSEDREPDQIASATDRTSVSSIDAYPHYPITPLPLPQFPVPSSQLAARISLLRCGNSLLRWV